MSTAAPPVDVEEPWTRPRLAWVWDLCLFTVLAGLFTLCSTVTLQGHDNTEWLSLMEFGGTAHPPGYPLYTLLLRLWGLLPHTNPAAHGALLSSLLMALAAVVLTHALEERNGHSYTARLGALAWALTIPVWRWAGVAEVVALSCLAAAAFIWAVHRVDNVEELKPRHGLLLGLILGVGAAHHHSMALLLPLLIKHVIQSHWQAGAARWFKAVAAGVGGGTAVLVLAYGLLMAWPADPRADQFSRLDGVSSVIHHLFRREYGTFSSNAASGSWSPLPSWDLVKDTFFGLHVLVLLAAVALTGRRAWMTLLCWVLTGPWLLGGFTVQTAEGQLVASLETRERFHALPLMLIVVMASDALAAAAYQLPPRRGQTYTRALGALVTTAVLLAGPLRLTDVSWKGELAVEDTFRAAMRSAPRNAVVVTTGDAWQMGFTLMALREHREDLAHLQWPRAFNGNKPDDDAKALISSVCAWPCPPDQWHVAMAALAEQRPVVFFPAVGAAKVMEGEPLGVEALFARLGPNLPPLEEQAGALKAFQEQAQFRPSLDDPRRFWEHHAVAVWAAPWLVLMDAAGKAGNAELKARAQQEALQIMGQIPGSSAAR